MTWPEFTTAIRSFDHVTVVGPLLTEPHLPTQPTIYVDGGMKWAPTPSIGAFPQISVGDGDSCGEMTLDIVLPAEKDFSDLSFALRDLPQSITHVTLRGFLGARRDHELCNLGEVHAFLAARSHHTVVEIEGEHERLVGFCKGRISREIHGVFSVLVLQTAAVRIAGACKYPLNRDRPLEVLSSVGLSNEGSGLVEIESGPPAFLVITSNHTA